MDDKIARIRASRYLDKVTSLTDNSIARVSLFQFVDSSKLIVCKTCIANNKLIVKLMIGI
nr:hypothetical protein [Anaerosalibacter bizertensis]